MLRVIPVKCVDFVMIWGGRSGSHLLRIEFNLRSNCFSDAHLSVNTSLFALLSRTPVVITTVYFVLFAMTIEIKLYLVTSAFPLTIHPCHC